MVEHRSSTLENRDPANGRHIDRLRTADFISFMDALTIITVVITSYIKVGSWSGLIRSPWIFVVAGVICMVAQLVLLLLLSGSMRLLIAEVVSVINSLYAAFARSVLDEEPPPWISVEALKVKPEGPLRRSGLAWYSLLILGALAMVLVVGGSGGAVDSPFRDILVAVFILGQFRTPTQRGVWAMFGVGLISISSAHALYIAISNLNSHAFSSVHFSSAYYIAPGLLVGLVSTLVYWLTLKREAYITKNSLHKNAGP